ncbi:MAG: flagellar basal body-associated protein FliL [Leptospirillia bacterium]
MAEETDNEVENEAPEETGEDTPTKGRSKLKLIVLGVGLLVILGGGAGAYLMLGGGEEDAQASAEAKSEALAEAAINMELDPFLVNLADMGGKHYLKTTLTLEVSDEQVVAWVKGHLPRVRDNILMLLSSKESKELLTADGKFQLRDEVLKSVNELLRNKGRADAVYLTEFVVQ